MSRLNLQTKYICIPDLSDVIKYLNFAHPMQSTFCSYNSMNKILNISNFSHFQCRKNDNLWFERFTRRFRSEKISLREDFLSPRLPFLHKDLPFKKRLPFKKIALFRRFPRRLPFEKIYPLKRDCLLEDFLLRIFPFKKN